LKIDAVPGRLSEQIIVVERPGLYWGQCSELCGPYHGFMPIVFEFATLELYINFMNER
jgi:heme/copper-type cytochrome/quinol oxidase subunit 2